MSTTTKTPAPQWRRQRNAPPQTNPLTGSIPEVDAKIDAYIKENPKYWTYVQAMPRDRLERTVVLNEVRQLDRQQRMREGMMKHINANPELKQAYDTLVKDVPGRPARGSHSPDRPPDPARRFPLARPATNQRTSGRCLKTPRPV